MDDAEQLALARETLLHLYALSDGPTSLLGAICLHGLGREDEISVGARERGRRVNCPTCRAPDSGVLETRPLKGGAQTRRRYLCRCGFRWATIEKIDINAPLSDGNYRGENWPEARAAALSRDRGSCVRCGSVLRLAVHHIRPFRSFFGDYRSANQLSNLETLCARCHGRVKT